MGDSTGCRDLTVDLSRKGVALWLITINQEVNHKEGENELDITILTFIE